jgi:hypothetical protein
VCYIHLCQHTKLVLILLLSGFDTLVRNAARVFRAGTAVDYQWAVPEVKVKGCYPISHIQHGQVAGTCFTFAGVPGWSLGQVVLSQVASVFSFPRDRFVCNTLKVGHDRFLSDALLRCRSVIRCCMVSNMGVN